jgi:ankyrin repeat protein
MKGKKPRRSGLRGIFIAVAAVFSISAVGGVVDQLPKDPVTDAQKVTTFQNADGSKYGYNISPSDQIWKHTLDMKTQDQRGAEMIAAAENGDSWRVNALIRHGGMNMEKEGAAALEAAALRGHADVVTALLAEGVQANANYSAAMRLAAANGHYSATEALLDAGAYAGANRSEALRLAAANGHASVVDLILAQKDVAGSDEFDAPRVPSADVNANGGEALSMAAANGHLFVVVSLIGAGANVNANDGAALKSAVARGDADIVSVLVHNGAKIAVSDLNTLQIQDALDGKMPPAPPERPDFG